MRTTTPLHRWSAPVVSGHGPGFPGRRAFAGPTRQLITLVAAFALVRTISNNGSGVISLTVDPPSRLQYFLGSYCASCLLFSAIVLATLATVNLLTQRGWRRIAFLTGAAIVISGVCVVLRMELDVLLGIRSNDNFGWALSYIWPRYAVLAALLTVALEFNRRETEKIAAAREAEREQALAEGDMAEARLQVLLARVEPHFLFNTLANLRRLYQQDRAAGRLMLESLRRYLEVALATLRQPATTLQHEADLVRAYLDIQRIRMGKRLEFSIEVPPSLGAHPIPSMVLLTLVENAIKHGLNPSPRGGAVRVSAVREGPRIAVSVADTGTGFRSGAGGGTGLANIRARLGTKYGSKAQLHLENNETGGATATIVLPLAVAMP